MLVLFGGRLFYLIFSYPFDFQEERNLKTLVFKCLVWCLMNISLINVIISKMFILITSHTDLKWLMIKDIYKLGMFGIDMYTLLYLKWITNKDLLYRELCWILCKNLNGERIWKRIDICIIESLCCTTEANTTLLTSYTPI